MILKRNFNILRVLDYVKYECLFASAIALIAYFLHSQNQLISLPFSIAAILGSALAIFIAFRNNNSYSRWWEARTLWGGIVNSSRVLARLVITFTDSHQHQSNFDAGRSRQFKTDVVMKIIAWAHAMRLHLRKQNDWEQLKHYVSEAEFIQVQQAQNKPNTLHLLTGQSIYRAMADGTLGGFDSFQMEGQLLALANYQGGCERIKNTPLLRQYDFFTRLFLYAFILILPFCCITDLAKMNLSWLAIPISLFISFVFAILGKVGEVNEDPFENRITDVPLNALCNTIERDLLDLLGSPNLPEKLEPQNGFLF